MQLITCEHPVKIFNRATGKYMLVPCGKCDLCRNKQASKWVLRLDQEARCWKYVMFFTLTYDEQNCPRMILQRDRSLVDLWSGEYVDPSWYNSLSSKDKKIVRVNKGVKYCSVQDVQKFIKRVRYYFTQVCNPTLVEYEKEVRFLPSEQPTLRYYVCGEISPTGYRPHYHGLLFFSSDRCAENIEKIIGACWKFGRFDVQAVKSTASGYVARYSSGLNSLPAIYQTGPFRPKALFSKCPPIGSLALPTEEIKEILFKGITEISVSKSDKLVTIPLYSWLKNRLFPKLRGFSCFSHSERVALYSLPKCLEIESFDEFKRYFDEVVSEFPLIDSSYRQDPCLPIIDRFTEKVPHSLFRNLMSYYDRLHPDPYHILRVYWNIASRVCYQSVLYGVTVSRYVDLIEQYYNNVEKKTLSHFYETLTEFGDRYGDVRRFIYHDRLFVQVYAKFDSFDKIPWWMLQTVDGFGIDPFMFWYDKEYREFLDPSHYPEYQEYFNKVKKILNDEHKNKAKKEYLRDHPECRIV